MNSLENEKKPVIGIIGGTGKEGKGLAYRWSLAGYQVIIGSRQLEKALAAAQEINQMVPVQVKGVLNDEAAELSDIVIITVPFTAHQLILAELKPKLQGKIVIDVTVPLVPPKVTKVQMPLAGSAALEAVGILGENVQVVSAFQNISYERLLHQKDLDCDVLVCGTSKEARTTVLELIKNAGLTGWDAGPIENSMVVEGLTSILLGINKQFNSQTAGIRITGINRV
jgi:NADPH-dependent F420 reductase